MANRRLLPVLIASVAILVLVIAVLALSVVPLPEYEAFIAGAFDGTLAWVDGDTCLHATDLSTGADRELLCESDRAGIQDLQWTEAGLSYVSYSPTETVITVDPETGAILGSERVDLENFREPYEGMGDIYTDQRDGVLIVRDGSTEIYRAEGPDRFWIEFVTARDDGVYAFTDSAGRLAVFTAGDQPMLVAEQVRSWGGMAFEPVS